ncbi:uncharacterized protein LOC117787120 [Drosophila innubila]|uniref:uncharacterized protein LOC117787120 n=1 Tax=Drosophila innubila TaxID=198719 RepID=UPI00148D43E8|nr:uncharacterized protein LOC117787120 [Drosophila innubila]
MYRVACLLFVALFGVAYTVLSQYDPEEYWVEQNSSYPLPSNAVVGGVNLFGVKFYVGMANINGTYELCRVNAITSLCSGITETGPFTAELFQVLIGVGEWIRGSNCTSGYLAVSAESSDFNETLPICRASLSGVVYIQQARHIYF